jgi:hypothetical protein
MRAARSGTRWKGAERMKRLLASISLWLLVSVVAPLALAQEPLAFKGLPLSASEEEVVKKYPKLRCGGAAERRSCYAFHDRMEWAKAHTACLDRSQDRVASIRSCMEHANQVTGYESVAGAGIRYMRFQFYEGKLSSIYFSISSKTFDKASTALVDAYGKPTSDVTSMVSNRMGAQFENRRLTWSSTSGQISITRYVGDLDTSSVMYLSPEGVEEAAKEENARRKKAAGDL